jgi:hypothetical protein
MSRLQTAHEIITPKALVDYFLQLVDDDYVQELYG